MKKMILISGKAEHGKTTVALLLKDILEKRGNKVITSRYAKYLKEIASEYCGWNGIKDEYGRNLLQNLGTEIIRQKLNKPLFHVQRICEDIEITQDYFDYVIIDDARYENEIYYPKCCFGDKIFSVRVERFDREGTNFKSSLNEKQKKHLTETSLDNFTFDYYIKNISFDILEKDLIKMVCDKII